MHISSVGLTDEEILHLMEDKRHLSPIINELCLRLEWFIDENKTLSDKLEKLNPSDKTTMLVQCPICEGTIAIDTTLE